ncbi:hypothetical protein CRENPOLYSF1_430022 [Crenothrix polyspora]|uniref:Uncharacterized protein n=1 Tax=Crenothrix polyspora TaxID=360316 RepID=A0A1R4HAW0_9GAMM|nr:hypothetical protein CRENPOLYSF1_430022 [Crenothrix polyspora]
MKLPNADKAIIPPEKLRDYVLSFVPLHMKIFLLRVQLMQTKYLVNIILSTTVKYSVRPELVEGLVVHGSTSSPRTSF